MIQTINSVDFQPGSQGSQKGAAGLMMADLPQQIKVDPSYHFKFGMDLHVKRSWKPQNRGISVGILKGSYTSHISLLDCSFTDRNVCIGFR